MTIQDQRNKQQVRKNLQILTSSQQTPFSHKNFSQIVYISLVICYQLCLAHIPLPPSTSRLTPVRKDPSSLARNKAVLATSIGSVNLFSGILAAKFALFSGVSSTPTNDENKPVPESKGAMALTRMLSCPYSAARPFVACTKIC